MAHHFDTYDDYVTTESFDRVCDELGAAERQIRLLKEKCTQLRLRLDDVLDERDELRFRLRGLEK